MRAEDILDVLMCRTQAHLLIFECANKYETEIRVSTANLRIYIQV
jgi:hypothetical protein